MSMTRGKAKKEKLLCSYNINLLCNENEQTTDTSALMNLKGVRLSKRRNQTQKTSHRVVPFT